MASEVRSPRRGPTPNPDRGTPSGYRISARLRFEMQAAAVFIGTSSLQETIDAAVRSFLSNLREDAAGFQDALDAAEQHRRHRAGIKEVRQRDRPVAERQ